jgi:hypothetical protein
MAPVDAEIAAGSMTANSTAGCPSAVTSSFRTSSSSIDENP